MNTFAPRLTNSQREVVALATAESSRKSDISIVKIEEGHAGVSYAAKYAERLSMAPNARGPRVLRLMATSRWDATMCLVKLAGRACFGIGYIDIVERCFKALSNGGQRPLCLVLDRAGRMSVRDQEDFAGTVEWCANHNGFACRTIYLLQKIKTWSPDRQRHERDWVYSAQLKRSATEYSFSAEGLDEIIGGEEQETNAAPLREVKSA